MFSASQYLDFALYSLLFLMAFIMTVIVVVMMMMIMNHRSTRPDMEGANYPTLPSAGNSAEPGMILAQKWRSATFVSEFTQSEVFRVY